MRTRVLVAAATLLAASAITACESTTDGTVAMTTEPGYTPGGSSSTTSSPRTTSPRTTTPRTTTPRTSSDVPPPGNALTMRCDEYNDLDPETQRAVIEEIVAQQGSVLGNTDIAQTVAGAVCLLFPQNTVSDVLLGGSPP